MADISPLREAQQRFIDAVPFKTLASERCPLVAALRRIAAQDVPAATDLPPYHRVIVEGFLVNAADTATASETAPRSFTIVGEVQPGDEKCPPLGEGQAVRVVTGSVAPDGPVAVVRQWEAKESGNSFTITRPFPPRFFIEDQGADLKQGTIVVKAGTLLTPWELALLASLGLSEVEVVHAPKVAIFSSGNEVIPHTAPLRPGLIRDCNAVMLAAAVSEAGGMPHFAGIMKDDFAAFVTAASQALQTADMLVISGGTAVNGRDFIADLLRALGTLIIDGVPMRSGRPLIMGLAGNKPIIAVAGHPPEALRGFNLFGVPAMAKLAGHEIPLPEDAA